MLQSNVMVVENAKRKQMEKVVCVIMDLLASIANTVSYFYLIFCFAFNLFTCFPFVLKKTILDIDDCLPNPCKNNGICLDGDGRFTCKCATGWSGM